MSSQMESNRSAGQYGAYRGSDEYSQQYEAPYQQQASAGGLDDNLVEVVAQRVAQRINQSAGGKIGQAPDRGSKMPPEQRTGIAIVSVIVLVPVSIVLGQQGFLGLVALAIACLAIFLINAVANDAHKGLW